MREHEIGTFSDEERIAFITPLVIAMRKSLSDPKVMENITNGEAVVLGGLLAKNFAQMCAGYDPEKADFLLTKMINILTLDLVYGGTTAMLEINPDTGELITPGRIN
jgi:hypothetical protein